MRRAAVAVREWLEVAVDTLALAIALLGWAIHVRTCRGTISHLRQENARLVDALSRALENGVSGGWRRAP